MIEYISPNRYGKNIYLKYSIFDGSIADIIIENIKYKNILDKTYCIVFSVKRLYFISSNPVIEPKQIIQFVIICIIINNFLTH